MCEDAFADTSLPPLFLNKSIIQNRVSMIAFPSAPPEPQSPFATATTTATTTATPMVMAMYQSVVNPLHDDDDDEAQGRALRVRDVLRPHVRIPDTLDDFEYKSAPEDMHRALVDQLHLSLSDARTVLWLVNREPDLREWTCRDFRPRPDSSRLRTVHRRWLARARAELYVSAIWTTIGLCFAVYFFTVPWYTAHAVYSCPAQCQLVDVNATYAQCRDSPYVHAGDAHACWCANGDRAAFCWAADHHQHRSRKPAVIAASAFATIVMCAFALDVLLTVVHMYNPHE